tara:strand:+ start:7059 stop:7496 length:438 start_codon:yes stop_codon:yes gene_type:complete
MSSYIILKCVEECSKLRIKFHSYVDENGKRYLDAYNNEYNCRFPKNIRERDRYYKIPPENLTISARNNSVPFYTVKSKNIEIISVLDTIDVYKLEECVICYDAIPNITLVPCGHHITCENCYNELRMKSSKCPLCRTTVNKAYIN